MKERPPPASPRIRLGCNESRGCPEFVPSAGCLAINEQERKGTRLMSWVDESSREFTTVLV